MQRCAGCAGTQSGWSAECKTCYIKPSSPFSRLLRYGCSAMGHIPNMVGSDPLNGGASGSCSNEKRKSVVFTAVRDRGRTVEVKPWFGRTNFYKEVKMPEKEAALVSDLARAYSDPELPNPSQNKKLNVDEVVFRIQVEQDAVMAATVTLDIGKGLLAKFVREHPLKHARDKWEILGKEHVNELKDEIVGLAPVFFGILKHEVTSEFFRAGCHKKDQVEIWTQVQENDTQELNYLKAIIKEKDAELEAKDAEIISLKLTNDATRQALNAELKARNIVMKDLYAADARAAIGTPFKSGFAEREFLENKEIKELKEMIRVKDAVIESKDVELASKDNEIAFLKEKRGAWLDTQLFTGTEQPGQPSYNSSFPQNGDDWMDETELDDRRSPVGMYLMSSKYTKYCI